MKATLFALFVGGFLVVCEESSDPADDPETIDEVIAKAIDSDKVQRRGKEGEKLVYGPNKEIPYTGWAKSMHKNGQFRSERNLRPKFNFDYREKGPHGSHNSIEAVTRNSAVIFEVKSDSGIGSGRIKLVEGNWPKKVSVRLHLKGLEGFSVSNGKKTIQRSDLNIRMLDPKANPVEGKYFLKKKGYYEATIPPPLLGSDVKELQISWVDFYRR